MDDREHLIDPLDRASRADLEMTASAVAEHRAAAAPEQPMDADGNPTVTECIDCGGELGERARMGRVRCVICQEIIERRRRGLFRGQ